MRHNGRGMLQVQVHPKQTSALVVFDSTKPCHAALATCKQHTVLDFPISEDDDDDDDEPAGLRAMVHAHKSQFPGNQVLQKQLDAWMAAYEDAETKKRQEAESAAAEDGWTVVTKRAGRKRKHGALAMTCSHSTALQEACRLRSCKRSQDVLTLS